MNSAFRAVCAFAAPAVLLSLLAAPVQAQIIPLPLQPTVAAAQRTCAARTPSGLGYTVLKPAEGAKPGATDYVLVNYIGYLAATGAVFDQAMRTPMPVDGVIPGFGEGLRLAARGGIVRLCIPAALGYGAQEQGPIPANSDLVFQVEVIDMRTRAELEAMQAEAAAPGQSADGGASAPATPPGN